METKNYKQWGIPHFVWDDFEHFKSLWNSSPGVHTVNFGEYQASIDILINDYINNKSVSVQPIFFSGAVSKRSEKNGPFFSGIGLANRASIPLISIADPGLDDNAELSLAWYTGSNKNNFANNLDILIEYICSTLSREPLFIGGSGGGFAALAASTRYISESSVLVWNPQTDIFRYDKKAVDKYLRSLFGIGNTSLSRKDWIEFCRIRTDKYVITNISDKKISQNTRRLVYLQNINDWHKNAHLQPFWEKQSSQPLRTGRNYLSNNKIIYVSDFAEGHAPPPEKTIREIITALMDKSFEVHALKI